MKKTLLLAGVACLFSVSAQAQDYMSEVRPYIGLDYAYDKADFKKDAKDLKDGFNSGIINVGSRMGDYFGLEAFYQLSDERKTKFEDYNLSAKFQAYGLDAYGYLPLGCEKKFDLLASLGAAVYDMKLKGPDAKLTQKRVGYRAGIGAQYNFTENFAARIMGRYNYVGTAHLNNFNEVTAGVRYTF